MSNWPSEQPTVFRETPTLSPRSCIECAHWRRSQKSPAQGHKTSLSLGALVTPPISTPCAPLDTADDTSLHRTWPVQKSNTIHTSHPSSLPFPRTPSSTQIRPPLPFRSSPRRSMSDGSIFPPSLASPLSPTQPEWTSAATKGQAACVVPPRRWDSLPLSVKTEVAAEEYPLEDTSTSSPSEAQPPSPATVKQKQYSKLRRHLGASIPPELVYGDQGTSTISPYIAPVLEMVFEEERDWKGVPELQKEEDSSDESESDESWESVNVKALEVRLGPPSPKEGHEGRYRGRWMREQGGRRWLVSDYEDIIQALRDL